ncbi:MAG: GGDEF domain-containing protein [Pseudomonadales bacterium]|nr:GGDEF domain-containing protein [Pseudomonadales bacterium]
MATLKGATLISVEANAAIISDLSETVLFKDVPQSTLSQFLARCDQAYFEKGEVLLNPDQNNDQMYLLLTGSVVVRLHSLENEALVSLGPGECVGEMSLFDGSNPSAFVVADEGTSTLVIDGELLWDMINESHEIARNLLYMLSKRIRTGNAAVKDSHELHKKAQQAADNDALTGVHNRRWLESLLLRLKGRSIEELAPLSVIMFDVDHFKKFNDSYGHQVGDDVLKMVADATQKSLRPNDMVARYGGEEFVILLPKTSLASCKKVAERLRINVASCQVLVGDNHSTGVTISLGVSQWQQGETLESLIGNADEALYRAKETGRDRVCE